jgi:RimJ/RimL family protein N-acetyltransferase
VPHKPDLHEDFRRVRPALEGELVRLRAPEDADADRLNPLFSDPEVLAGLRLPFPQSAEEYRDFVRSQRGRDAGLMFTIETLEGEPVGGCGLMGIDARARDAELGIWIAKPHWNRGYGSDAMRVLCRFGFRHLNLQRITLHVYETNRGARRVYERVGFKHEGTLRRAQFIGGRYVDATVMGLLSEEFVEG